MQFMKERNDSNENEKFSKNVDQNIHISTVHKEEKNVQRSDFWLKKYVMNWSKSCSLLIIVNCFLSFSIFNFRFLDYLKNVKASEIVFLPFWRPSGWNYFGDTFLSRYWRSPSMWTSFKETQRNNEWPIIMVKVEFRWKKSPLWLHWKSNTKWLWISEFRL